MRILLFIFALFTSSPVWAETGYVLERYSEALEKPKVTLPDLSGYTHDALTQKIP